MNGTVGFVFGVMLLGLKGLQDTGFRHGQRGGASNDGCKRRWRWILCSSQVLNPLYAVSLLQRILCCLAAKMMIQGNGGE
jgi:hypothetical protein